MYQSLSCALVVLVFSCVICSGAATARCVDLHLESTAVSQVLIVEGRPNSVTEATLQSCEKINGTWANALPTYDTVVGKNGISQPFEKKEGDGLTPAGTFPLGELFGWTPPADPVVQAFKNDYRYIVDTSGADGVYLDKFIDDSSSVYYNSWVSGATTATSYEQMRIDPYKYGLVVNYNMHPTIAGKGSAIFMHIWSGPDGSTAGCIALDKANLITVLQWLDKSKQPHIKILPPAV